MQLSIPGDTTLDGHIKQLASSDAITRSLETHLHTLRKLGNNTRHANTDPFTAADKPKVAHAVFAVATTMASMLCTERAGVASPATEVQRSLELIRSALGSATPSQISAIADILGV